MTGVNTISKAHLSGEGLDADYIDLVLMIHSIALAGFKFLTGFIYDKFGIRITSSLCCVAGVVVMVCLALVTNTTTGMVLAMVYGAFSSLALPLETVMLPIYANDLFGEKSFGKVLGLITAFNTAGYAVGAPLSNIFFDILGDYKFALLMCAGIMLIVVITLQFVISKAHKLRKQVEMEEEALESSVA